MPGPGLLAFQVGLHTPSQFRRAFWHTLRVVALCSQGQETRNSILILNALAWTSALMVRTAVKTLPACAHASAMGSRQAVRKSTHGLMMGLFVSSPWSGLSLPCANVCTGVWGRAACLKSQFDDGHINSPESWSKQAPSHSPLPGNNAGCPDSEPTTRPKAALCNHED